MPERSPSLWGTSRSSERRFEQETSNPPRFCENCLNTQYHSNIERKTRQISMSSRNHKQEEPYSLIVPVCLFLSFLLYHNGLKAFTLAAHKPAEEANNSTNGPYDNRPRKDDIVACTATPYGRNSGGVGDYANYDTTHDQNNSHQHQR